MKPVWWFGLQLVMASWSVLGAAGPVKLALIVARTGIGADENLPALKAAELAVEQINACGGLQGHNVELVVVDNTSTPLGSKKAVEYAVSQGVIGVIGAFRSSHSLAMVPVVKTARIPMITPTATNPEVTLGSEFIFRTCFTDEFQGRALAEFARKDLKASGAVVLTNLTEDYCIALARYFSADFKDSGGKVLWEGAYQGNATDFKTILASLKPLQPEVIFIPGMPGIAACSSTRRWVLASGPSTWVPMPGIGVWISSRGRLWRERFIRHTGTPMRPRPRIDRSKPCIRRNTDRMATMTCRFRSPMIRSCCLRTQ